jgi:hypothetical protein
MAKKLDPAIGKILNEYGFSSDACWDCHGTWVVYHKVLEQVAVKAGITFDQPYVMEANGQQKCAAICVTGHLGERAEWSIGEAAPGNNKNAYPFAMAEKRGKDRVILKLVGLHGLAYSEEEADSFQQQRRAPPPMSGPAAEAEPQLRGAAPHPSVEKAALAFKQANEPHYIPVPTPENGDMESAWKIWISRYTATIEGAATTDEVNAIEQANKAPLDGLQSVSEKGYAHVVWLAWDKRNTLEQTILEAG